MKLRSVSRGYLKYGVFLLSAIISELRVISAHLFTELSKHAPDKRRFPLLPTWQSPFTETSETLWQPPMMRPAPPVRDIATTAELPAPEKTKTLRPIFFPYTIPLPWPTPFNGTYCAPVPKASPAMLPIASESLNNDTYPLIIAVPQFEYVPLYYSIEGPVPTPNTSSSGPETPPETDPKPPVSRELVSPEPTLKEAIAEKPHPLEHVAILSSPGQTVIQATSQQQPDLLQPFTSIQEPYLQQPNPPQLHIPQKSRPQQPYLHQLSKPAQEHSPQQPNPSQLLTHSPEPYMQQQKPSQFFTPAEELLPQQRNIPVPELPWTAQKSSPQQPQVFTPVLESNKQQRNPPKLSTPSHEPYILEPIPFQLFTPAREPRPQQPNSPQLFSPAQEPSSQQPKQPQLLNPLQKWNLQKPQLTQPFTPFQKPSHQQTNPPPLFMPVEERIQQTQPQFFTPIQEPFKPVQEPIQHPNPTQFFKPVQESSTLKPRPTQSFTPVENPVSQQLNLPHFFKPFQDPSTQQRSEPQLFTLTEETRPHETNPSKHFTLPQEPSAQKLNPTQLLTPVQEHSFQRSHPLPPYATQPVQSTPQSKEYASHYFSQFPSRHIKKTSASRYSYPANSHENPTQPSPPKPSSEEKSYSWQRYNSMTYGSNTENSHIPGRTKSYPQETSFPIPSGNSCPSYSTYQEGQQPAYVTIGPGTYGDLSSRGAGASSIMNVHWPSNLNIPTSQPVNPLPISPDPTSAVSSSRKTIFASPPQRPSVLLTNLPPIPQTVHIESPPTPSKPVRGEPTAGQPTASETTPSVPSTYLTDPCDGPERTGDAGYIEYGPDIITIYE